MKQIEKESAQMNETERTMFGPALYTNRARNQTLFTNTLRSECICLENCAVRALSFYFRSFVYIRVTLCVQ